MCVFTQKVFLRFRHHCCCPLPGALPSQLGTLALNPGYHQAVPHWCVTSVQGTHLEVPLWTVAHCATHTCVDMFSDFPCICRFPHSAQYVGHFQHFQKAPLCKDLWVTSHQHRSVLLFLTFTEGKHTLYCFICLFILHGSSA